MSRSLAVDGRCTGRSTTTARSSTSSCHHDPTPPRHDGSSGGRSAITVNRPRVVTDQAPALRGAIDELAPAAFHSTDQYANHRVQADHGRLKAPLRPMRGLKRHRTATVIIRRQAFIQNLRRHHYELGTQTRPGLHLAAASDELTSAP